MTIISNYGELKTEIARKINRTDITSAIPGFVQRAEEEFNREMRQVDNLHRDPGFTLTGEYTTLPSDWQEGVAIEIDSGHGGVVSIPVTSIGFIDRIGTHPGTPIGAMVVDNQLRLVPPPASATSCTLVYYRGVTTITGGDSDTNWLLDNHSGVYLFRSLMEAALHMKADKDIQRYGAAYQAAMASVLKSGRKKRQSSAMYVRLG